MARSASTSATRADSLCTVQRSRRGLAPAGWRCAELVLQPGAAEAAFDCVGGAVGAARVSLGLAKNPADVDRAVAVMASFAG